LVGEHGGLGRHDKQILVKEETQVRSFEHKEVPSPRPPVRVCTSSKLCVLWAFHTAVHRAAPSTESSKQSASATAAKGAGRRALRARASAVYTQPVLPYAFSGAIEVADGRPPGLSTLEEEETFFVVHARVDRRLLNVVAADESEVGYLDLAVLPSLCTRTSPAANLLVHLVRRSGAHHACPCKVPSSQRPARRQRHSAPLPLAAGP
jgi:hypothetical protein